MYRISEFDVTDELKPSADTRRDMECTTYHRPPCLGRLLEEYLLGEIPPSLPSPERELEKTGHSR